MASSSNALTPNKNNTLMRLLRDLKLSRKEAFEQLRKDKEQSDQRIQEHIQRLEAREKERDPRKRGHSRRNLSQEKQTPKIPKFYGGSDPDEMPRAKGPTTRAMARRIQEEWALNAHARPKMNFTWAKEDVKT